MRLFPKLYLLSGFLLLCLFFQKAYAGNPQASPTPHRLYQDYNIIFIYIDDLRADHLGCYGYNRQTSPNIDELAKESVVFEQNFTPITFTMPSWISTITSLYPSSHGVLAASKDKLSSRVKTLAEILQIYGYKTAWFGPEGLYLDPAAGFSRGFDEAKLHKSFMDFDIDREDINIEILDWLEWNRYIRFFLNFHTYQIHAPCSLSLKYKENFSEQKIKEFLKNDKDLARFFYKFIQDSLSNQGRITRKEFIEKVLGEDLNSAPKFVRPSFFQGEYSLEKFEKGCRYFSTKNKKTSFYTNLFFYVIRSEIFFPNPIFNKYLKEIYDTAILEFDQEVIGPLIKKLKSLDLFDKTIIIFFSDHGEEFREHNGGFHGRTLYDEVTHVPLIIRVPWIKVGKRIKELTQTVDILPTLLDLLGIPIPHQAQGKSAAPLINNEKSSPIHDYVFGQLPGVEISSIRSKEWQFIFHKLDGKKELYRLESDSKEQQNVFSENQGIALKLELTLKQWEASLPSYIDEEYSFPPEIDKATQEKIRKTGYF